MPGSHVHVQSDADLKQSIPLAKVPKWAKVAATVIGSLAGLAGIAKAAYEALK